MPRGGHYGGARGHYLGNRAFGGGTRFGARRFAARGRIGGGGLFTAGVISDAVALKRAPVLVECVDYLLVDRSPACDSPATP
jgi:hypothetical protein